MIAVTMAPTSTPRIGLERVAKICANSGTSASGFTAASMVNIPVNSTEKPSSMVPISLYLARLPAIKKMIPTTAMIGARVVGLSRVRKKFAFALPSRSPRRRICAVTVVPIFPHLMTPMQERSFKIPIDEANDNNRRGRRTLIAAVTSAPSSTPFQTLLVSFSSVFSIRPPESFSGCCPARSCQTGTGQVRPPRDTTFNQSIPYPHWFFSVSAVILYNSITYLSQL